MKDLSTIIFKRDFQILDVSKVNLKSSLKQLLKGETCV
jgi:hypothetical protein